jgi:hypothetical protein
MREEFFFTGRLWFAVDRKTVLVDDITGRIALQDDYIIAAVTKGDKKAVIGLTDEDLMERYLRDSNDPDLMAITPRTHAALLELLQELEQDGFTHVAFDPVGNVRLIPMSAVLEGIRKGRN